MHVIYAVSEPLHNLCSDISTLLKERSLAFLGFNDIRSRAGKLDHRT